MKIVLINQIPNSKKSTVTLGGSFKNSAGEVFSYYQAYVINSSAMQGFKVGDDVTAAYSPKRDNNGNVSYKVSGLTRLETKEA